MTLMILITSHKPVPRSLPLLTVTLMELPLLQEEWECLTDEACLSMTWDTEWEEDSEAGWIGLDQVWEWEWAWG
jgi:hypothetical protein